MNTIAAAAAVVACSVFAAHARTAGDEIEFPDEHDRVEAVMPRTPGDRWLSVSLPAGVLRITGTSDDKVVVRAAQLTTKAGRSVPTKEPDPRADGLTRLSPGESGLMLRERNRGIEVLLDDRSTRLYVDIRVPRDVALSVSSSGGTEIVIVETGGQVHVEAELADVYVHDAAGDVRVQCGRGSIRLTDISGPIEANTDFGSIDVMLRSLDPSRPVWLTAAVGPIDIALPSSASATLQLRSTWGDIYSDFDMVLEPGRAKAEAPSAPPAPGEAYARTSRLRMPPPPGRVEAPPAAAPEEYRKSSKEGGQGVLSMSDEEVPATDSPAAPSVASRIPAELAAPAAPKAPPTMKRYRGTIGSGGADIRITSGSKNIYVRKAR